MSRNPFSTRWFSPLFLALSSLLIVVAPPPVAAQYMYLDSDGDGVHTSLDGLNQVGATHVDVWLRTDHNRDGSVATCSSGEDLTMFSYVVRLRASGGTVSFANATNLQPGLGIKVDDKGSDTEYVIGYAGLTVLSPGTYLLARISVTPATGTPSLAIVKDLTTVTSPDPTSFGSHCSGRDFDNTMKLGTDWFDVDGLPSRSGGMTNLPPAIASIRPLSGPTGTRLSEDIGASDPNGDAITIRKGIGPTSLSVTQLENAPGAALARLFALGRRGDVGVRDASLIASDGISETEAPFTVEFTPGPNHPPAMRLVPRVDVPANGVATAALVGVDSDGDPLIFSKRSGPDYATVTTLGSGPGSTAGLLTLHPPLCASGDDHVVVAASDGGSSTTLEIPVRVFAPSAVASPGSVTAGTALLQHVVAADFDEDGHIDLATANANGPGGEVVVYRGDGTGALRAPTLLPIGHALEALATGDWDGDGHADLAAGPYGGGSLIILYGNGDGTFRAPAPIPSVASLNALTGGDLNGDGIDDLVAVGFSSKIDVLLGSAGAGLGRRFSIQGAAVTRDAAIADFDRDGFADLAVAANDGTRLYRGRGDGTFGDPSEFASLARPYSILAGDWNGDGSPDLAVASIDVAQMAVLLGDGIGGFSAPALSLAPAQAYGFGAADWNGDGASDLLLLGEESLPATMLYLGDGHGGFTAGTSPGSRNGHRFTFADLNEDGRPDVAFVGGSDLTVRLNTTTDAAVAAARAFATSANRTVPVNQSSARVEFRLEPIGHSFELKDIDPASIRLTSSGTGSASSVAATAAVTGTVSDSDENGIDDLAVGFAVSDLGPLFDRVSGRTTLPVHLTGALTDGRRYCAGFELTIAGKGQKLTASVEPNPLNPSGVLRFSTERRGPVTIRLYDLHGRQMRTIWNARVVEEGEHQIPIEARDGAGRPFASGVYFYRIEAGADHVRGRFTVLK